MTNPSVKDVLLQQGRFLKREEVDLTNELGIKVWVRGLSGSGLVEYLDFVKTLDDPMTTRQTVELMACLVSLTACDEDGNLLFSGREESLGLLDGSQIVLKKLSQKANELSGLAKVSEVAANLKNEENSASS